MKFAIFGNTYQAKKSSHAENLFRLLAQHQAQLCVCRVSCLSPCSVLIIMWH